MNESRSDRLMLRVGALEARCHELEHDRAANVQSQIADLQERVRHLENERSQAVPAPVGLNDFHERFRGHCEELAENYRWASKPKAHYGSEYLERLAGVACTLRDAYELARTGEDEQAMEKMREIEW